MKEIRLRSSRRGRRWRSCSCDDTAPRVVSTGEMSSITSILNIPAVSQLIRLDIFRIVYLSKRAQFELGSFGNGIVCPHVLCSIESGSFVGFQGARKWLDLRQDPVEGRRSSDWWCVQQSGFHCQRGGSLSPSTKLTCQVWRYLTLTSDAEFSFRFILSSRIDPRRCPIDRGSC